MSEEQLSLGSWAENQAKVQGGTKLDPDHGTFTLSTNTVKGALEITRAAFGLVAHGQMYETHLNWLVGDLMWNGSERFGDNFDQELDTFAGMVGWTRRRLIQREKTSRLFADASLRRYSYDEAQWREFFPDQVRNGVGGVRDPLCWDHYREAGLVAGIELPDIIKGIQIAYYCRFNAREIRTLLSKAHGVHGAGQISDYLDDVLESAAESSAIAMEKIDLLERQHNEDNPKGKYILITAPRKGEPMISRVAELSPARYEGADMVIKIGGTNGLSEVISYDGISEELEAIPGTV